VAREQAAAGIDPVAPQPATDTPTAETAVDIGTQDQPDIDPDTMFRNMG
jgi:hypothetical protein